MRIAIPATYTPRVIMDLLVSVPMILLMLFGITLVVIGGYYLFRVAASCLHGEPYKAFQKRTGDAIQAANLGWLAIACGPLLAMFFFLGISPFLLFLPDVTTAGLAKMLLLMTGVGAVAGIIAGGAFWVCSALFRPVRKSVNRVRRAGVWDPDLDGMP